MGDLLGNKAVHVALIVFVPQVSPQEIASVQTKQQVLHDGVLCDSGQRDAEPAPDVFWLLCRTIFAASTGHYVLLSGSDRSIERKRQT